MIQSIEQERQEDGELAIAKKIKGKLKDLQNLPFKNKGRWAWELLQNARDSVADIPNRKVTILIELNPTSLTFSHNGSFFTSKDIRGLINQLSSKDEEQETKDKDKESEKVGRFGTGFITTHLLSKRVQVSGPVKTTNNLYYQFSFLLDRTGTTTLELKESISKSWKSFHDSSEKISTPQGINTSFTYTLVDNKEQEIAKIGIEEFKKLIPYVMVFNSKIEEVEIRDYIKNENIKFTTETPIHNELIVPINQYNGKNNKRYILYKTNETVSIAIEVEKDERGYVLKSIEDLPKLFCGFPLIGTERFYFPAILNSFYFNPLTERHGIFLAEDSKDVIENRELLKEAFDLYKSVVDAVANEKFYEFFHLVDGRMPDISTDIFDINWYKEAIQKPLRAYILQQKIVELEEEVTEMKSLNKIFFPSKSHTQSVREKLRQFTFDLYAKKVCKESHLHQWCEKSWDDWNKLTYSVLFNSIANRKNILTLSKLLQKSDEETINWLNDLFEFVLKDKNNSLLFETYAVLPNRNGQLRKESNLHEDRIKDDDLIQILYYLGEDWKNDLIHPDLAFNLSKSLNRVDLSDKVKKIFKEKNKGEMDYNQFITSLSQWFDNNPKDAEELFGYLYRNKDKNILETLNKGDREALYDVLKNNPDWKQISKISKAVHESSILLNQTEELNDIFSKYGIESIPDLLEKLEAKNSKKGIRQYTTIEAIISMGITSLADFKEAMKVKDLKAQFTHISDPDIEMFKQAQKLINRSKENVIKHLKLSSLYNCDDIEESATTILVGVLKNERPIHIVVRPSDNKEVIIFYSSEKDTLDHEDAELWIDNGKDTPKHLTLGKIIKTTGINRIPI